MTSPRAARVQTWGFFFATSGGEWNPHKKILFDEAKPIIICRGPQMALHPPPENPIGSSPGGKFRWLHPFLPFLPSKGGGWVHVWRIRYKFRFQTTACAAAGGRMEKTGLAKAAARILPGLAERFLPTGPATAWRRAWQRSTICIPREGRCGRQILKFRRSFTLQPAIGQCFAAEHAI